MRWRHPERGDISPAEFIPAAERAGCMADITRFVVKEACAHVRDWRVGPLRGAAWFKLAINVSGTELGDHELATHIGGTLASTGLPPDWVHLEVTETALIDYLEWAVDGLMELRMLGVRPATTTSVPASLRWPTCTGSPSTWSRSTGASSTRSGTMSGAPCSHTA